MLTRKLLSYVTKDDQKPLTGFMECFYGRDEWKVGARTFWNHSLFDAKGTAVFRPFSSILRNLVENILNFHFKRRAGRESIDSA